MTDSFNRVIAFLTIHFIMGLSHQKPLEIFLNETRPPTGEALDLGSGEGRTACS